MKFFEMFPGKREAGVRDLHPAFRIKEGSWYHNRAYNPFVDREIALKVRFSFDDPSLLDNCPFMAKVGLNQDPKLQGRYIGFAYGQSEDRESLVSWAQHFHYAELIVGLDTDGVSTLESKVIPITTTK